MSDLYGIGLDKRQARRARRRAGLTPDDGFAAAILTRGRKYLTRSMKAHVVAAEKYEATLIQQECSEGNCIELIDPKTGENTGGWGPVGCPCQDEDGAR